MGGLAIKKIIGKEARRISRDERNLIVSILESDHLVSIPEIREKESFGDIDFLMGQSIRFETWKFDNFHYTKLCEVPELRKLGYSYNGYVKNGNVRSIALSDIQIDVIRSKFVYPKNNIEYYYFSYNDLGNLIGRIAHHIGLKFGHEGLFAKLPEYNTELFLTNNFYHILEFLGLDPWRHIQGFDTFNDMFEYVVSSYLFNGKSYLFENLNNENRTRNVKRKTYANFVEWLHKTGNINKERLPEIDYWRITSIRHFNKESEYNQIIEEYNEKKAIKAKFNGHIVSEITGLQGKELGKFIIYLKENIDIEKCSESHIKDIIKYEYERMPK